MGDEEKDRKMAKAIEIAKEVWKKITPPHINILRDNEPAQVSLAILAVNVFDHLTSHSNNVRVKIVSEMGNVKHPAKILIYENEQLLSEMLAKVEHKFSADGSFYPCVNFEKK